MPAAAQRPRARARADRRAARAPLRHPPRAPVGLGAAHPAHARRRRAPRRRRRLGIDGARGSIAEHGLDRVAASRRPSAHTRLRWQAERPGALWHGDVCHGPALLIDGKSRAAAHPRAARRRLPLRRRARGPPHEREVDMLGLLVAALRRHGPPDALYLDNGSTYRGDTLRLACERLGITLLHARPYDAPGARQDGALLAHAARGLPRLTSAASPRCTTSTSASGPSSTSTTTTAPHAGLLGRTPAAAVGQPPSVRARRPRRGEAARGAHRARAPPRPPRHHRRHRRRATGSSTRASSPAASSPSPAASSTSTTPPWVEHEGKRLALHPVDPVANAAQAAAVATTPRPRRRSPSPFDPAGRAARSRRRPPPTHERRICS